MRYEVVSGKEYPVYSRKEADELGLSYKHPFEVSEGEYGISSDGEVAICLKRNKTKNGKLSIKYPWGPSFVKSINCKVISEGRLNNYNISGKQTWGKHLKQKDEYIKLEHLMAQPGMKKEQAIKMVFGNVKGKLASRGLGAVIRTYWTPLFVAADVGSENLISFWLLIVNPSWSKKAISAWFAIKPIWFVPFL